jgi:glutathione S-transferase
MAAIVNFPAVYCWNILAATGMALHVIYIGGAYAGYARKKYGIKYPDMGSGRHSQKLTDVQWEEFNNYQRAHGNYVEGVSSAITFQLLSGLFYPKAAAIWGLVYLIGRQIYAMGYARSGSNGRMVGALLLDVALVAKLGLIVTGCLKMLGYISQ